MRTVPEEDGSFLLTGLSAGRHVLRVRRPLLANWGMVSPSEVVTDVGSGEVGHVRLRVPSVAEAAVASCGGGPRPRGTAAFLGRIATEEGSPMADNDGRGVVAPRLGVSPPPTPAPLGPGGRRR